jgi:membrane protein implicated in regulation of membrane protease activity
MSTYVIWFVLAAVLVGAELLSGTFYLLVYGVAASAGGLAALAGLPVPAQLAIAAACAVAGTLWLRRHPVQRPVSAAEQSLEIGRAVEVVSWQSDTHLRVRYRGAGWDAERVDAGGVREGTFYIVGQRGNTLLLSSEPPARTG